MGGRERQRRDRHRDRKTKKKKRKRKQYVPTGYGLPLYFLMGKIQRGL